MLLLCALPAVAETEKQPPIETVVVLVARKEIPYGTFVKEPEQFFKEVRYVKGDEPKNAVTKFEQVKGKRTLRALAEDQPVKAKDVGDAAAGEVPLPKGMRALAVKVALGNDAVGFVLPGSRVDVIHTVRKDGETTSTTLLQNVLVLGLNTSTNRDRPPTMVTLAVSPDDAAKIRVAESVGELSFTLRTPDGDARPDRKVRPDTKKPADLPPFRSPGGR
jgi:pilus assembly protein CpaB